jgi:hypothetical protein
MIDKRKVMTMMMSGGAVVPAPTITSFTPGYGAPGDTVTITGTNFTGATACTIGGAAAVFVVVNPTTITATVPAGAVTGVITVTTPGGVATSTTEWILALLRDEFTTDEAAPLASPRTCEPGPGTLTAVQTDGQFSIAGGKLEYPVQATPTWGDLSIYGAALARSAGLAVIADYAHVGGNEMRFGWSAATTGGPNDVHVASGSGGVIYPVPYTVSFAVALGARYAVANILRGVGGLFAIKGGIYTDWNLLWVNAAAAGNPLYPIIANHSAQATHNYMKVVRLPAPFDSDFGLATTRLAGARAAGDTATHTADCLIEYICTTRPSAGAIDMRFRQQDADNYWQVTIDSTGAITLNEVVAGVATQRGTAAGVVANGHRVVIIANGQTIRGYSNNVLRWTYASAANFATQTTAKLEGLGTAGAVSDIVTWPRTITGAAATILDTVTA